MRCLAIGGCHMEGYPIGYEHSYMHQLSTKMLGELHIEANFPLSHVKNISKLIQQFKPAIVVLQLGNYEFDASISKTIQFWRKKRRHRDEAKAAPVNSSARGHLDAGHIARRSPMFKGSLMALIQWALVPFIYMARNAYVREQLQILAAIIAQHPNLKFVILTPLPLNKGTDNWIRKKAAALFKTRFGAFQNAVVIDTHEALKHPPIFSDASHLNKTGHMILEHAIEQEIGQE